MADNTITIVGNVTREPELRFTPNGQPKANFQPGMDFERHAGWRVAEDVRGALHVTRTNAPGCGGLWARSWRNAKNCI